MLLCALAGAAFAVLAVLVAVRWGPLVRLDRRIDLHLNDYAVAHRSRLRFWRGVTNVLSPAVLRSLLVLIAVVLLVRRRMRAALFCGGVALGSLVAVTITKAAVNRPRPRVPLPVDHAAGASFPSGHAATSAAVAFAVIAVVWPLASRPVRWAVAVLTLVVAAAVAFSRLILGVHFLSDVVGGWLLAAVVVSALIAVLPPAPRRRTSPSDRAENR